MPRDTLCHGLRHVSRLAVVEELTVPALRCLRQDDTGVRYRTRRLVEATCLEALQPHLAPEEQTVGTRIVTSHRAATPVGMTVTAEVELVEVNARRLRSGSVCLDEVEVIGDGDRERFIFGTERFLGQRRAQAHSELAWSVQHARRRNPPVSMSFDGHLPAGTPDPTWILAMEQTCPRSRLPAIVESWRG